MPRPPRIDYEGAWHHVVNRGAGRACVFANKEDYQLFLDCVSAGSQRYGLEVHCYCLLGNHFHLLVLSRQGQLSAAMRFVSGRFTRSRNVQTGSDGAIFRGRFFSKEIRDEAHLAATSRYIHLNPVSARMAAAAEDWPWSSAAAYLTLLPKPSFLSVDFILDLFGPSDRRAKYKEFLLEGVDAETLRRNAELEI